MGSCAGAILCWKGWSLKLGNRDGGDGGLGKKAQGQLFWSKVRNRSAQQWEMVRSDCVIRMVQMGGGVGGGKPGPKSPLERAVLGHKKQRKKKAKEKDR